MNGHLKRAETHRAPPPAGFRRRPRIRSKHRMPAPAVALGFRYEGRSLTCDGVPLEAIAAGVGTPCYVYSAGAILTAYHEFARAFAPHAHTIHYALKANSNLVIARLLKNAGAGADANSGGEIEVALRAGFRPDEVVFTGVGKTRNELERAIVLGLKALNAESASELERIDAIARHNGRQARVALRVNPDIDAESHPHISTGLGTNKFGFPARDAVALLRDVSRRPALKVVGIHLHVGSQITKLDPLRRAAEVGVRLVRELRAGGVAVEHLDLGGGLGIPYADAVPSVAEYARSLLEVVGPTGIPLIIEPGRAIVGPAGALVGRVVDVKPRPDGKHFVVLDTGMTELIRPAMYGAFHQIAPVERRDGPTALVDIVGPLCETSDTLGADRDLPLPQIDDLMAVRDVGAYGAAMASTYNRRMLAPEVMVEDGRWRVIRRRQTIEDQLILESEK
jgi:diaminopimelate decarboxylase